MARFLVLLLFLTIPLFSGCNNDGILGPNSQKGLDPNDLAQPNAAVTKPFHGAWDTTFGPPDATGVFTIHGAGQATHLGATTFVSSSSVDGFGIQTGTTVNTAANGDVLIMDFVGPASPPDAAGNITFSGTFEWTDGSGRFLGASGGGTYQGTANVFFGVGEFSQDGTLIVQPGSRGNRTSN